MPLRKGSSKKTFEHNLTKLMREGYKKNQAVAIAYSVKRREKKRGK